MTQRRLRVLPTDAPFPAYVVWELTLRCDHACRHCGSRALRPRPDELSTHEALEMVDQLAAMGAQEVVLIGGEAYLHDGFLEIVRALAAAGIRPTMTTGGFGITLELAAAMAEAGLHSVSVSIDGLESNHDTMRAKPGSFRAASSALQNLRAAGLLTASNINVNRLNRDDLEPLYDHLKALGIKAWQVQLTAPLGRAADRADLIFQPWMLLEVVPRIAALKRQAFSDGITLMPGNNLGYFGPEEALLRSVHEGGRDHFRGCQAGKFVMGIESHGAIKGCPSLQSKHYVGGNVRDSPISEIWETSPELGFTRARTTKELWGFCASCPFADVCLGGCTFTAHALMGRPGNNPYCHFRAQAQAKAGVRERLVPVQRASGQPFDSGRFEVVLEPIDAPDNEARLGAEDLVQIRRAPKRQGHATEGESTAS